MTKLKEKLAQLSRLYGLYITYKIHFLQVLNLWCRCIRHLSYRNQILFTQQIKIPVIRIIVIIIVTTTLHCAWTVMRFDDLFNNKNIVFISIVTSCCLFAVFSKPSRRPGIPSYLGQIRGITNKWQPYSQGVLQILSKANQRQNYYGI